MALDLDWALEPELPFIASCAALELDEILAGQKTTTEYLPKLLSYLQIQSEKNEQGPARCLFEPPTAFVFGRAYMASFERRPISTTEDMLGAIMAVTKAGKELNSNDPESLKKLRLFCLELSSFAISFREQVFQGDSFEQCAL